METLQSSKQRQPTEAATPHNGHGQAAPQPSAGPGLNLQPDLSSCEAGRKILASHFDRLVENEAGTVEGTYPEPLHDMRVATRRLRAALRDFRPAFGKPTLKPFERDVRWLGSLLGQVRDSDVFIEWLRNYEENAPAEQRPYVHRVVEDRQSARVAERAALLTGLASERYRDFKRAFGAFLEDNSAACDQDNVAQLAVSRIGRQMARVYKKSKGADDKHLALLHRLRIESKRLRYTAEFFSSLYSNRLDKLIKRARDIQNSLGKVHDTAMYIEFLEEMRRIQAADTAMCEALDGMLLALRHEQEQAYGQFEQVWDKFDSRKYRRKVRSRLTST